MMITNHPFHMVTMSPWPMLTSINIMNVFMSFTIMMYLKTTNMLITSMLTMIMCMIQWWRDVIRESTFQGYHTLMVTKLIKMSMILFIISELMFFVALFWTYFHSSITPSIEIGMTWPPTSIKQMNPYNIPMLNSVVLVSSGITVTWTHYALLTENSSDAKLSFMMTIILGVYFTLLQIIEYFEATFCFNDSIYGSIFFMTTGFHGSHVNIGLIFLTTCFMRMKNKHFSKMHHLHFETASWYWHFVDIIWLFLYITIYWWNY
uniref:Cytochrome c oxidase subunit 3 n=1 Tax=Andrena camellia TaxID=1862692 RepID=A0A1W2SX87_9HYME|nr:cytochrome c oxidase subunit III [Andrena camellia]